MKYSARDFEPSKDHHGEQKYSFEKLGWNGDQPRASLLYASVRRAFLWGVSNVIVSQKTNKLSLHKWGNLSPFHPLRNPKPQYREGWWCTGTSSLTFHFSMPTLTLTSTRTVSPFHSIMNILISNPLHISFNSACKLCVLIRLFCLLLPEETWACDWSVSSSPQQGWNHPCCEYGNTHLPKQGNTAWKHGLETQVLYGSTTTTMTNDEYGGYMCVHISVNSPKICTHHCMQITTSITLNLIVGQGNSNSAYQVLKGYIAKQPPFL